jgi:hypothetical protein
LRPGDGKRWAHHLCLAVSGQLGSITRLTASEYASEQNGSARPAQAP